MKFLLRFTVLISGILLGTLSISIVGAQENFAQYRVLGTYSYYNIYEDYFVTDVPAESLTHLVYEHIGISDNGQCESLDEWADVNYPYPGDTNFDRLKGNFRQLQRLKERNPNLRLLMSIGGWEVSSNFSSIAGDENARIRLARSCISFMREYDFDGIVIDWRYPVEGGRTVGSPDDYDTYPLLLSDFRGQMDYWQEEDEYLYTLAITAPATPDLLQHYWMDEIAPRVDFVNLMAFSFEGTWSEIAAHHSPLYVSDSDPRNAEAQIDYTVSGAVETALDLGLPSSKIVLGVAFFGQSWQGVRPNNLFGLFSPVVGVPNGTREQGRLYYQDLANFFTSNNYVRYFDASAGVPWLYNENAGIAISYEDVESLRIKSGFVQRLDLAGMAVWELSYDDDQNTLVSELYRFLNGTN